MDQEDRIDIYTIPPNFAEEGTMLSGRIKTRNAVEAAVILMILVPLLLSFDCSVKAKMYSGMIGIVPVVILAIIGVQGESLFAFVASFFRYLRSRRCLTVPDDGYRLEQNRWKERGRKGENSRGKRKEGRRQRKKTGEPGVETGTKTDETQIETGEEESRRRIEDTPKRKKEPCTKRKS